MEGIFCPAPPVKKQRVSEDYVTIDSRHVRDELESRGWQHLSTQFPKRNPAGKHLMRFENPLLEQAEGTPQLLVWNSYTGTYSLKIETGYFRFVCSNGLVIGVGLSSSRTIHRGEPAKSWRALVWDACERVQLVVPRISEMKEYPMREIEILDFGARAAALRFGLDFAAHPEMPMCEIAELATQYHRVEDRDNTLWNVFNRTQENLLHGGFRSPRSGRSTIELNPRRKADFNSRLWDDVVSTYLS